MASKLTVVTGNTKKFGEMEAALEHHSISVDRANIEIDEIQSLDAEAVVRDKAVQAFSAVGGPVLVDDAGFYIERYNSFPGVMSKFVFFALGYEGLFRLCTDGDAAHFVSYVAYMDGELDAPQIFRGEYPGTITTDFDWSIETEMPYAPLFIPKGASGVMSEMSERERSSDHRHTSLNHFAEWYRTHRS